ncbi:MAG: hypothetical protein RL535_717, partial [Pseudomonadota bacterium]
SPIDPLMQSRAASTYIRSLKKVLLETSKYPQKILEHVAAVDLDRGRLNTQLSSMNAEKNALNEALLKAESDKHHLTSVLAQNAQQIEAFRSQWENLQQSRSWRLARYFGRLSKMLRGVGR